MAIYPATITTEALDLADLKNKMRAYRELFDLDREILTYVQGIFKDRAGELIFLTGSYHMITVATSAIMWYDRGLKKNISITPVERFILRLGA